MGDTAELLKKENGLAKPVKERKKHDRFNGMPEEEVVKRTLPDHLTTNLDIVIVSPFSCSLSANMRSPSHFPNAHFHSGLCH